MQRDGVVCETRIEPFGHLPDGREVHALRLENARGFVARVITYGARLQSMLVPDAAGGVADVVLGYPDLAGYLSDPAYLGATVGRWANRIAGAKFSLGGEEFVLTSNDGPNSLHGGTQGFDSRLWTVESHSGGESATAVLSLFSPDGEEGFPGDVRVRAVFTLDREDGLTVEYEAVSDRSTILNLTHHSYWNLAGEASDRDARGQELTIDSDAFLPIRPGGIPTGEFRDVAGTPFDFGQPRQPLTHAGNDDPQLQVAGGYDHCWTLIGGRTAEPRLVATLRDPASRRAVDLWSDQPGLQFYGGNFLSGERAGKCGRVYRPHDGLALEPQLFPDTPNQPAFGSGVLEPGEIYRNRMIWRFYCD
ncbi:galactose-1-epimerase [Erythrobacter sp. 3-20A1M]|uniref:aldose epimerase family protein n=1 Tax=Erythrobacter sp. 3-20A1M TaxID=2653850 RepID=UPI001BFC01D9|nr:aldose epimerase family protein [Erythrobacter sp. 3-20A1M]QWC56118.1 galactose-1-epimerase [Erythrobacter sp. 3-20A1M]